MPATKFATDIRTSTEMDFVPKPIRDYLMKTLGFSKTRTVNVYSALGAKTIETIQADPYSIMKARAIAFTMADRFAKGKPFYIKDNDPRRLKAAVESGFSEIEEQEGHTYTPRADVIKKAYNTSKVSISLINEWLDKMLTATPPTIVSTIMDGTEVLGLPGTWETEARVGKRLTSSQDGLNLMPVGLNPDLDADQRDAVLSALTNSVTIITGGPGRGKSHVIGEITRQYALAGVTFALMAPTGKAAVRMSELSGYPASTIHKFMLAKRFAKIDPDVEEADPYNPDVIIIDESSMLTIHLMGWVLDGFGGHLVIVGDADQLPPIGAGQVLHDVIASGEVPTVELKTNHRSADVLGIAEASEAILSGSLPSRGPGFAWVEDVSDSVYSTISVFKQLGEDLRGAPVLAYTNAEVAALNEELRALYNPTGPEYVFKVTKDVERIFRIGDPVMNTKNNYDLKIMNGETGRVVEVIHGADMIRCDFNGEGVLFDKTTMRELVPAYAYTCHKMQGSQAEIVVVSVKSVASWQKWIGRSWIYTATSRASKACILVGDVKSISRILAVQDRGSRRTRLQQELRGTVD